MLTLVSCNNCHQFHNSKMDDVQENGNAVWQNKMEYWTVIGLKNMDEEFLQYLGNCLEILETKFQYGTMKCHYP